MSPMWYESDEDVSSATKMPQQYPLQHQNAAFSRLPWPLPLGSSPSEALNVDGQFPAVGHPVWVEPLAMPTNTSMSFTHTTAMPPPPPKPTAPPSYNETGYQLAAGAANDHTRTESTRRQGAPGPPTQRKARMRPPSESAWEGQKEVIRTLYMERRLPLSETMEHMETILGFKASEKMYKQMFKKWRWSKNLPKDKATWMINRANQRKPSDTEFRWGDQVWTAERVRRTHVGVHGEPDALMDDHPTPSDISYGTPRDIESSANHVDLTGDQRDGDGGQMAAESARTVIFRALNTGPVHLDLKRTTLEDLRALIRAARDACLHVNVNDSETQLQDALCGFSHLLSPTHEEALKAGYHLASFYADHGRMDEADETLNWMTEQHKNRHGIDNEKTLRHLTRVVDLLQNWGRNEHASLLAFRILDSTEHLERLNTDVLPQSRREGQVTSDVYGAKIVNRIASLDDDDSDSVKSYLRILRKLAGKDKNVGLLREILPVLTRHCDNSPDTLSIQRIESRCLLAEMETQIGDHEAARTALAGSEAAFSALLRRDEDMPESVRSLGRRLAFSHLDAQDRSTCDRLLETMAGSVESRAGIEQDEDADALAVNFLVSVGNEYHRRTSSWKQCRPWIERALGLCILVFGPRHPESKRLMRMLDANEFEGTGCKRIEDFMKFSGRVFKFKIV